MRSETTRTRTSLLLAGVLYLMPTTLDADILPPGSKGARHSITLDFGVFRDHTETSYRIVKGDTLGAISKRELGSARRFRDILAANAGLDPLKLKPGQVITLPPKAIKPDPRYHFAFILWSGRAPGPDPQRIRPGGELPRGRYGVELIAVRFDQLAGLMDARQGNVFDKEKLANAKDVARGNIDWIRSLPRADPATSISTKLVLRGLKKDKILMVRHHEYRSASGRVVRRSTRANDASLKSEERDEDESLVPFLFMILAGGLGLIWLVARTRSATTNEPHPASTPA